MSLPHNPKRGVPRDMADGVLRRAIELQAKHGEIVDESHLHSIARELGIESAYVQRALAEAQANEDAGNDAHRDSQRVVWAPAVACAFIGMSVLIGGAWGLFAVLQTEPVSIDDYVGAALAFVFGVAMILGGGWAVKESLSWISRP